VNHLQEQMRDRRLAKTTPNRQSQRRRQTRKSCRELDALLRSIAPQRTDPADDGHTAKQIEWR
jgi:hypothetical protein